MCLLLYVAASQPLFALASDRNQPRVSVEGASRTSVVRQRLAHPFVYKVGSRAGCGCAFDPKTAASHEDRELSKEFRQAVVEYLSSAATNGPVQLLGFWDSDESLPMTRRGRVVAEAVLAESFPSGRPTLLEVCPRSH